MDEEKVNESLLGRAHQEIDETDKYRSKEIDQIVTAFIKAENDMTAPDKSGQGNRGKYSKAEDFLTAAIPSLRKHGIKLYQHPHVVDGVTYMHSTFLHTSGQWLDARMIAEAAHDTDLKFHQAVSSAFTYTKRQMLSSQLGFIDERDAEEDEGKIAYKKEKSTPGYISEAQKDKLLRELKQKDKDSEYLKQLIADYGNLSDIPWKDFNGILDDISKLK